MARKFGGTAVNRAGTGKIDQSSESSAGKWAGAVRDQVQTAAKVKTVLAKTIPVSYIKTDPENPRKLDISQEEITNIAEKFPMDGAALLSDNPDAWLEGYIDSVSSECGLEGKPLGDLISIIEFAAGMKSADRMMHPIVVWQEESTFHLIAGERRLLSHIMLGESHITARIQAPLHRHEIDTLQWEENVHREPMSLWEKVDRVRKLIEAGEGIKKTSVTKLSKIIGRSRPEAQRYLAVLRCPTRELINAIEVGLVNDLKKAAMLAQLPAAALVGELRGETKVKPPTPAIKVHKSADIDALATIVEAAAEQLKETSEIKHFDLSKPSGITEAINALMAKLGV